MRNALILFLTSVVLTAMPAAGAQETDAQRVLRLLSGRIPGIVAEDISESPVENLFQVVIGSDVVYVTDNGRYLLTGNVIDLDTHRNLTEEVLARQRVKQLAEVGEEKMIIFEPNGEVKHTITTFTDIDCPYCRTMHREMSELNALGIRVRYMLFPRAGADSVSYEKAVSVWCAEDRQAELTLAKRGEMPKRRECKNPIAEHMTIARDLGLQGTPMTITDTGERLMGYVPAAELNQLMESTKRAKQP